MDLNKVMIIGRVTQDPETRNLQTGQNVSSFSLATNRSWKDKSGQKQERAEFHNIVVWGKLAEIVQQYVKKGMKIYIEGRLQTRSWDDPQGNKKYRTEIVAEEMIMLDSKNSSGGGSNYTPAASTPAPAAAPAPSTSPAPEPQVSSPGEEISVEDIPF